MRRYILTEKYLTVNDIRDILSISRTQAYTLVNQNGFPKIKIGSTIRVPESEFNKYMKHFVRKQMTIIK